MGRRSYLIVKVEGDLAEKDASLTADSVERESKERLKIGLAGSSGKGFAGL